MGNAEIGPGWSLITQMKEDQILSRTGFECVVCGKKNLSNRHHIYAEIRDNNGDMVIKGERSRVLEDGSVMPGFIVCGQDCRHNYLLQGRTHYQNVMRDSTGWCIPYKYTGSTIEFWNKPAYKTKYEGIKEWVSKLHSIPFQEIIDGRAGFTVGGWFLFGEPRSGKSLLASAFAYELRKAECTILFADCADVNTDLRAAINSRKTENEQAFYRKYLSKDALILDDLDLMTLDRDCQVLFFGMINKLYNSGRILIATSTANDDRLKRVLGERVVSRLRSMTKGMMFTTYQPTVQAQ